ncbi:MAG TPA: ABC transporter ATP-binding protein [Pirellulaceae bacterium]|jgi:ABC-2 type transport system ATP-binding protein|nr:ABC transporter ATP-binding protein [Pirellulaceae bacterium]
MIRVEQLTKTYGEKEALRGVTFAIEPGQVCGYLGPNGAGKSTTVRILTGVMPPTSGAASVAGFDVAQEALEVKRRIGYVPESAAAYSTLSVEEYLALVGALHHMDPADVDQRSRRTLELFGIKDSAQSRIDTLSKGMRQKVVITAALIHDPEVLLFDEPLSGLDVNAARVVKDVVRGLADRGKTVLYCSHVLDVVERLCDRVIILDHGRIVADGTPAQLKDAAQRETLESVFRSLTSSENQDEIASDLVEAVSGTPAATSAATTAREPAPRPESKKPHGKGKRR